jgi:hypothetical protein
VAWTARVAWIVLPLTTGAALGDVFQPWSRAPEIVAVVLLWAAWFAGLIALFSPRPWGFTILRVVAPCALALGLASAWSAAWPASALAIGTAALALATSLSSATAHACAASTAYGPERRFPLRVPVTLMAGPVPVSVALIAGAIASGPLLLANGNIVAGVIAVALGVPIVGALARSLTALDHRWVVLVPAGLVVVDPLTFPDPVLLPREHIESLRRTPRGPRVAPAQRDPAEILVGGAGPVLITCREIGTFFRRSGRGNAELEADRLRVWPLRPEAVITAAGTHRIPVA